MSLLEKSKKDLEAEIFSRIDKMQANQENCRIIFLRTINQFYEKRWIHSSETNPDNY